MALTALKQDSLYMICPGSTQVGHLTAHPPDASPSRIQLQKWFCVQCTLSFLKASRLKTDFTLPINIQEPILSRVSLALSDTLLFLSLLYLDRKSMSQFPYASSTVSLYSLPFLLPLANIWQQAPFCLAPHPTQG